jgi:STE24 endopeptidase
MNTVALIILFTILFDVICHGLADCLNLKMLRNDLPESFKGVYDAERYRQSQEYLKTNTRFGWVVSAVNVLVLLAFWFGKGFPWLDGWVRCIGVGPIISGLIYIGILLSFKALISLPFSAYHTFVIEERFGFNQTTWSVFVLDIFKGLLLAVLIGTPLLAGVLAFFEYAGEQAWWYCWIAVTLYALGVQFIAPTWIMPLFNKFVPLESGELRSAILSYAASINFPADNVFVMDGSRRSSKSNAFFTGFGKHKRIVLLDTLIKQHSISELIAILAHEMGHYKKRHMMQNLVIGILQMGIMLYLLSIFISYQGLFDAFFMSQKSIYAGLIFFALLYSPLDFIVSICMHMLSRKNETIADHFSAETTGNPSAMITALKKLSVGNLTNLQPHPFYVFLNYSHPPILERINALQHLS